MPIDIPVTPAVRMLRAAHAAFMPHLYGYLEKGGTAHSAASLGVAEHSVVKTLVMEDEHKKPLIMLMHGDKEVSTKNLARQLAVKTIVPCTPETATRHTGYMVGGTSPFGTRKPLPVYMETSIAALPVIYINGGKRGFLVALAPEVVIELLRPTLVSAAA